MRVLVALGVVVVAALALGPQPAPAANENKPRTPVVWGDVPCMTIVDRSQTPVLHLDYTVLTEESYDLTEDEVEDSRRHQFFAFAAQHYEAVPPTYITWADIDRAAPIDDSVVPDSISPDDVLETATRWPADEWVRVTPDDMRVPITMAQAMMGVDWDLSGVRPGTWLVKGYTWEPIFNLWSTRWGAIKVIDGADEADEAGPSLVLLPDDGLVTTEVEHALPGCIDAPTGSTMTLEYGIPEGSLEPHWKVLEKDVDVTTGPLQQGLVLPADVAGCTVALRATITDPEGRQYVAYGPKDLVVAEGDEPPHCEDVDDDEGGGGGCSVAPDGRHATPLMAWLLLPCLRRRRSGATLPS